MKENSAAIHVQVPVDVATFLLNEKRADIHAVEARLKVNVVLIPNIHLETPHYKVERLRHDDLNQEGVLPPSYNLVEAPAEEQAYASPQEARPPRPQAAVQGVTPEQPAPIAAPRPVVAPPPPPAPAAPAGTALAGSARDHGPPLRLAAQPGAGARGADSCRSAGASRAAAAP